MAILDAAEKLFSERGFAGTSLRDISDVSGVSQPLIHHHFGSKNGLYREVQRRAVERFWEFWSERISSYRRGEIDVVQFLAETIRSLFWFIKNNANVIRLSCWACLEGDTDLWPGEKESVEFLAEEISKAQQGGVISSKVDPYMFTIMINAVTIFWWQYRANLIKLLGAEEGEEKISEDFIDRLDQEYLDNVLRIFVGSCVKNREKV